MKRGPGCGRSGWMIPGERAHPPGFISRREYRASRRTVIMPRLPGQTVSNRGRSWRVFAIGVMLLPYLTLSGGPAGFVSMSRFNLVSFPLFVVLANLGLRAKWLLVAVIGIFSASLFMNAALFAKRIWIG